MTLQSSPTAHAGEEAPLLRRLKLFALCLLLTALSFSVEPGRIISDTKIDLALNPLGFMERALHLWDPAYFGQLQNQAYGYFFPSGPFHAALLALDMPAWMVQRTWMAALLCASFLGIVALARALGIGTTHTQILAGLAYALAPRVLTLLSYNSAELLPGMMLPWVLLPLVYGARGGTSPARAALLSASAFLLCGGVNAAAELAILVVPLLYLLTRSPGPRKRRLLIWWAAATSCVSLWFMAPLVIMGRYVFDFMPYTEDAATTTGVTSLVNVLRGSSNWMGYLYQPGSSTLPAGAELANLPLMIVVTAAVAGLGLAGLAHRGTPERTFLITTLLTGTAILVSGHTGALTGPLAETVQSLFNAELGPFRNVHKFDAVVRLPLVLGLAHLPVAVARRAAARRERAAVDGKPSPTTAYQAAAVSCAAAVAAGLTPLATAGVATPGGFPGIPDYWHEAIEYIDAREDPGMTMAVPGSARGEYLWGRPLDEPMQPLMEGRWTNHHIIPWGSAGVSRLMHDIDQRLSSGRGSPGLADTLARMGVSHLLVRNDLQRDNNQGAWPARVHQALEESPGITKLEGFGPEIGAPEDPWSPGGPFEQPYEAVEVYAVDDPAPPVGTVPRDQELRVTGGPESLLALAEEGLLNDDRPVVLGDDPGAEEIAPERTVSTDTARLREVVYPDVRRNVSPTLASTRELEREVPAPDITDGAWDSYTGRVEYSGIAEVSASSSQAGALAAPELRDPGRAPYAALDGNDATAWRSGEFTGALGQWLQVRLEEPRDVEGLHAAFEWIPGDPPPAEVEVATDQGSVRTTLDAAQDAGLQQLATPPGETEVLRLRVTALAWEPEVRFGSQVGIGRLDIPGLEPARTHQVAGVPDAGTLLFTGSTGTVPGCMRGSLRWLCDPRLEVQGEDARAVDRGFTLTGAAAEGPHHIEGRVVVSDARALENTANRASPGPEVTASSAAVDHPAALGHNAFDGDPSTAWIPDPEEARPWLEVDFGERVQLGGLLFGFPEAEAVQAPIRVTVDSGTETREAWLDSDGLIGFDELDAEALRLTFDPPAGQPLQVSGVVVPELGDGPALEDLEGSAGDACGTGPTLRVNGQRVETRLDEPTVEDVLAARPVRYETCSEVPLGEGENRVVADGGTSLRVESVALHGLDDAQAASGGEDEVAMAPPDSVEEWGPGRRTVAVEAGRERYLVVNENFNEGWRATLHSEEGGPEVLEPVRLDGWRQGWELPDGAEGRVVLDYTPDTAYHLSLAVGAFLAFCVVVGALFPRGRRVRQRGGRALPGVDAATMPAPVLAVLATLFGIWVAGAAGAAVFGAAVLASWWLGRRPLGRGAAGAPGTALRLARAASGPWLVTGALVVAGGALALGGHLNQNYPFHEISGAMVEPLRGWIPQLLCLPALARLAVSLWPFDEGGQA